MMTDPIADMLTRIRNGIAVDKPSITMPASKIKAGICRVLKEEGYIKSFKIIAKDRINIKLKVVLKDDAIKAINRVSKPGLRMYSNYNEIPRVLSGLGMSILSTSKGIISSRTAKKEKIGGEILCSVW
jgi:small subunit ribosomal protein S8